MMDALFVVILCILCVLLVALFVMLIRIVLSPEYAAEEARMEEVLFGERKQ
jgi:hypothetical protein